MKIVVDFSLIWKKVFLFLLFLMKVLKSFAFGFILATFLVNKYGLELIRYWKIEYNDVVISYLKVLVSFPSALLILGLILLVKFDKDISYILKNIIIKAGGVEVGAQQSNTPESDAADTFKDKPVIKNISADKTEEKRSNELSKGKIDEIMKKVDFSNLDNFLVEHTKDALRLIRNLSPISKETLFRSIPIPESVKNVDAEKVVIVSVLMEKGLIENDLDPSIVKISEKGKEYLDYLSLKK